MASHTLANAVVIAHMAFVLFVIFGGFWVRAQPRVALLHLPAIAWAVFVEFTGTICPLTPLELALRQQAGEIGYGGGFVEHICCRFSTRRGSRATRNSHWAPSRFASMPWRT